MLIVEGQFAVLFTCGKPPFRVIGHTVHMTNNYLDTTKYSTVLLYVLVRSSLEKRLEGVEIVKGFP